MPNTLYIYIYIYIYIRYIGFRLFGLYGLSTIVVFANGPGDRGSIPGRVIPNTQKMVLDAS